MKKIALHWQILIALALALIVGLTLRHIDSGPETPAWIVQTTDICKFIGDLFMSALKMLIVPLIASSVIAGLAGLAGIDRLKQLGAKTLGFYFMSTLIAATVGLVMVNSIKPGEVNGQPNAKIEEAFQKAEDQNKDKQGHRFVDDQQDKAKDWKSIFFRMFPQNIVQAATSNGGLLGVLVFSLLFGIAMTQFPRDQMSTLREFFECFNQVMVRITQWVMAMSPIGLFGMMVATVYSVGADFILEMKWYFITVLCALAVHLFVVLPLLLKFIGKVNPFAHFAAMKTAMLTAFSTASSAATLPVTMRCVQDKAGVSKQTASFTLPLGATVNMDGTALYECVAVIFVAQVFGVELSIAAQMGIVFVALLTSIGVAGIPSASLVAILIIMGNVGIEGANAEMAIYGLFAVDRLLDMSRTSVNVFGDSCAAVVIAKSEGEDVLSSKPTPEKA